MKLAPASRGKGPANRAEAWACLMSNLALPGSGSLAAGLSVGYSQLVLAAIGFIFMSVTTVQALRIYLTTGGGLDSSNIDPSQNLLAAWRIVRGPLAGLAVAAIALIWALATSLRLLSAFPKNPVPPRLVP